MKNNDERWRSCALLTPMSQVAGRMSIQLAAQFLETLMVEKVLFYLVAHRRFSAGKVVIIGGGGFQECNAAEMAVGLVC